MTHPLAALLKDVPRYRLTGYDAGTQPDGAGDYVAYHEVLAALEAAEADAATLRAEVERLRGALTVVRMSRGWHDLSAETQAMIDAALEGEHE